MSFIIHPSLYVPASIGASIIVLSIYLKLQMAEFSWSYGRGRFFGHYGLLLFPCFLLSFPGKGQHIFLVFIVTYVFAVFFFFLRCSGSIHIWVKYA